MFIRLIGEVLRVGLLAEALGALAVLLLVVSDDLLGDDRSGDFVPLILLGMVGGAFLLAVMVMLAIFL